MKNYTVQIEQTQYGYKVIEAASEEEALAIANIRFNAKGEELPEMDDCQSLRITVVETVCECCLETYNVNDMADNSICLKCKAQMKQFAESESY